MTTTTTDTLADKLALVRKLRGALDATYRASRDRNIRAYERYKLQKQVEATAAALREAHQAVAHYRVLYAKMTAEVAYLRQKLACEAAALHTHVPCTTHV